MVLFLWSYIQLLIRYFVATGSQQLFSTGFCENCSVFSDHLLTHPMFHSCTTIHFSPMSHTAWFWLLVSFSISFSRWYHSLQLLWSPVLFFSWCLPDHQALILILSHLSILFPLLLILSVFPSFINRFLLVSISFAFSNVLSFLFTKCIKFFIVGGYCFVRQHGGCSRMFISNFKLALIYTVPCTKGQGSIQFN